jgi:hypothetical protein
LSEYTGDPGQPGGCPKRQSEEMNEVRIQFKIPGPPAITTGLIITAVETAAYAKMN